MFFTKFYSKPNMPSVPFHDEKRKAGWAEPELQVTRADGTQTTGLFPSPGGQMIVGSSPKANLILEDAEIAERHLRFYIDELSRPIVEDLNSSSGTCVNGQRITQPTQLKHLDEVRLGRIMIRYVCYRDQLGQLLRGNDAVAATEARPAPLEKIVDKTTPLAKPQDVLPAAPEAKSAPNAKPADSKQPSPKPAEPSRSDSQPAAEHGKKAAAQPKSSPASSPDAPPRSSFSASSVLFAILIILLVIGYFMLPVVWNAHTAP